ncbi:hypothetical protein ZWY2020_042581 [Hordeum vulgare]|nr:hypothetical protein ZWY2020_042581 [Hordeum vulgare]
MSGSSPRAPLPPHRGSCPYTWAALSSSPPPPRPTPRRTSFPSPRTLISLPDDPPRRTSSQVHAPSTRSMKFPITTVIVLALYTGIKKVMPVLVYSSSAPRRGHSYVVGWWKLAPNYVGAAESFLQLPLMLPHVTAAIDIAHKNGRM